MSDFDLFSIAYSELKLCYLYPLRLFLIRDYNNQLNLLYKRYKLFICLYLIMINIFLRWFLEAAVSIAKSKSEDLPH